MPEKRQLSELDADNVDLPVNFADLSEKVFGYDTEPPSKRHLTGNVGMADDTQVSKEISRDKALADTKRLDKSQRASILPLKAR